MSIQTVFEHGSCKLQVAADFKVSQRVRDWVSGAHAPALQKNISKEFRVTSVSVNGFEYSQVATSGALAPGKYWINTSNTSVDELHVEARETTDEQSYLDFDSTPTENQLRVGTLGETIPGDADEFSTFIGPFGMSSLWSPSELSVTERNWWAYITMQHFYHYMANYAINVYGWYEPYFIRSEISSTDSFFDAYADEFQPGPYFDYVNFDTFTDNLNGLRNSAAGTGWVMAVRYVSGVSGASTPVNLNTFKETYLVGGDRRFDTFLVSGGTEDNLFTDIVRVEFALSLAKLAEIDSDIYRQPRIISAPKIEKRIEGLFGKPIQRGAGTLVLNNSDGYFDSLRDYNWAGNICDIIVKAAKPDEDLADGESQATGRFLMTNATFTRDKVEVKLEELTKYFDAGFPLRFFDELPDINIYDETQGRHCPYIYGRVFGVRAYPVNKSLKEFQVADHAIHSISNPVRIVQGVAEACKITFKNYESGRFRIEEWEDGQDVICDVNGLVDSDNKLMNNPADIANDILKTMGFAPINAASITDSRTYYDVGGAFPFPNVDKECGLYIYEPGQVGDIFQKINESAHSYLRFNNSNEIEFRAWYPKRRTDVTFEIQDFELLDFREMTDEREIITQAHSAYEQHEETDDQRIVKAIGDGKDRYNLGGERVKEFDSRAALRSKARNYAQKVMTFRGQEIRTFAVSMMFRPITLLPGDQIRLNITRWGFDEIVEILSVSSDVISGRCEITFSNRRNWGRSSGWWSEDVAPTYSLLDSEATKQANFEQWGYWSDDNGFLDDQDVLSFETTRYL